MTRAGQVLCPWAGRGPGEPCPALGKAQLPDQTQQFVHMCGGVSVTGPKVGRRASAFPARLLQSRAHLWPSRDDGYRVALQTTNLPWSFHGHWPSLPLPGHRSYKIIKKEGAVGRPTCFPAGKDALPCSSGYRQSGAHTRSCCIMTSPRSPPIVIDSPRLTLGLA